MIPGLPPEPKPTEPVSTYGWAEVTQTAPLRIKIDGQTAELPITPDTLEAGLSDGDRVWVQQFGRRVIVLGKGSSGGPPSGSWVDVPITDTTNFEEYDVGTTDVFESPQVRLVNGIVFFRGALEVETSAYVDGTTWRPFANIPVGYRPGQASGNDGYIQQWVCPGDAANRWVLRVKPNGEAAASRYGPASSSDGNVLLAFSVSWVAES